jgi:hypothetical protein
MVKSGATLQPITGFTVVDTLPAYGGINSMVFSLAKNGVGLDSEIRCALVTDISSLEQGSIRSGTSSVHGRRTCRRFHALSSTLSKSISHILAKSHHYFSAFRKTCQRESSAKSQPSAAPAESGLSPCAPSPWDRTTSTPSSLALTLRPHQGYLVLVF